MPISASRVTGLPDGATGQSGAMLVPVLKALGTVTSDTEETPVQIAAANTRYWEPAGPFLWLPRRASVRFICAAAGANTTGEFLVLVDKIIAMNSHVMTIGRIPAKFGQAHIPIDPALILSSVDLAGNNPLFLAVKCLVGDAAPGITYSAELISVPDAP